MGRHQLKLWFNGLRGKLLFSAFIPVVALALVSSVAILSSNKLGSLLDQAYTEVVPNFDYLGQMTTTRARIGYYMWVSYALSNPEERKSNIDKLRNSVVNYKNAEKGYESIPFTPEEEINYAVIKEKMDRYYSLTEDLAASLEKNSPEEDAKVLKAIAQGGEWNELSVAFRSQIQKNIDLFKHNVEESDKIQREERNKTKILLLLLCGSFILVLFGVLMIIAYRVSSSVGTIASKLTESGYQVAGAITQLSAAGQNLSEASTESAASLEETVAALEEMSSMVQSNSNNAKQAALLSQNSREAAEKGQQDIRQLIESMQAISKSSHQIEEIISVIDDIAFQTNLLALNAAVEAARAGEQGKGFAVVAEAVRTLAQRSAVAAKDITSLIKDSVNKVESGTQVADRSGASLNNIVDSVKKVADLNTEISVASEEQTAGIQQIGKAMSQLDQSSQSNAASSEEIASTSEEISGQAEQMKCLVSELNILILGQNEEPSTQSCKIMPLPKKKLATVIPLDTEPRAKVGTTKDF